MNIIDVLNSPWALPSEKYAEIRDLYERHAHGDKVDIAALEAQLGRPMDKQYRALEVVDGVGILTIDGIMAKRMNLMAALSGGTSTQLLQRDFALAMTDQEVHSILLVIDSPGGEVSGTQEFCNQIFDARGIKPIVAVCEGMLASAAYWIASAANEVYISSGTAQVGSIGVVAVHKDKSKSDANQGVKVTEIAAGKYKRVASEHEPLSAEGRDVLKDQVDQIYTVFVDDVARNRGVSSEKVLSEMADGRIFIGQKAIDAGLVDGKRTTQQALQKLKDDRQKLLYPQRSASAANHDGGTTMGTPAVTQAADIEAMRKLAFDEGFKAGADAERSRIQAVEEQGSVLAGHEDLVAKLKFDGKTTGDQAAAQILAAEKKKLGGIAVDLRTDAPKTAPNAPTEDQGRGVQKIDATMSQEQVTAVAKENWLKNPKLHSEFTSEAAYTAFCKAEAAGRVRILNRKPA
jgi:signal peptide peptidase SppA